jgi:hypothetical protein
MGSFVGCGVVVGEAELGAGLEGWWGQDGFVVVCMEGRVRGGGGGEGMSRTGCLLLKSITASFLSSSAAQQLKKGFFFYTG